MASSFSRRSKDVFNRGLNLSIFLHALVLSLAYFSLDKGKEESEYLFDEAPASIESTIISEAEYEERLRDRPRIVETEAGIDVESDEPSNFLSDRQQRVDEEMVNPNLGSVEGVRPMLDREAVSKAIEESEIGRGGQGSGVATGLLESGNDDGQEGSRRERSELQYGSLDDLRDSVAIGPRTILNTDRYIYASFFNRVSQQLVPIWRGKLKRLGGERLGFRAGDVFLTSAQVFVDAEGNVKDVRVKRSSGVRQLDEAASSSLKLLPRLDNLPQGLDRQGDLFSFDFGFEVTIRTSNFDLNFVRPPDRRNYQYMR